MKDEDTSEGQSEQDLEDKIPTAWPQVNRQLENPKHIEHVALVYQSGYIANSETRIHGRFSGTFWHLASSCLITSSQCILSCARCLSAGFAD